MKFVSHKLSLVLAGTALLLAGCPKTPRPDPSLTTMGPKGDAANQNLNPVGIPTPPETTALTERPPFDLTTGQNREMFAANSVYFAFDQSAIKASEREKLKAVKAGLDKDPTLRLLLEGHCDWRGTAEYNLGLGDRRAAAAKKYLISLGVAADKLDTVSKGSLEAKPNADAATMEKDRRVDCVALKATK